MPYEVALVKCPSYAEAEIHAAVEQALAPLGGMANVVRPGQRVLLKLNLLAPYPPERAVTTHPALVKTVVRLVQAAGGRPVVGDSPGGTSTPASYQRLLQVTGIQRVIDETGCDVAYFDGSGVEITPPRSRLFKRLTVAAAPVEADVVIGLPKLKTHQLTYLTGAVKLLYGYLPGISKVEYHLHAGHDLLAFNELLVDIYEALPPALTIMDAVVAMEGFGPSNGDPRQVGLVLASRSATALDFVAAETIGLSPMLVPTVRLAADRGIGPGSLAEIMLYGEALDDVRITGFVQAETVNAFGVRPWMSRLTRWLFSPRPVIVRPACKRCGKCIKNCPPKTIAVDADGYPCIGYGECLRCFCCHEMCPAGAIRVARPRVRFPRRVTTWVMGLGHWLRELRSRWRGSPRTTYR